MNKTILVAGGTGNLGGHICRELLERGADVKAVVRKATNPEKVEGLRQLGIEVIEVDFASADSLSAACAGVNTVVSALAGLREVIVDVQKQLAVAAQGAGVLRFIPSDFCTDYTQLTPGENRNFDLRRTFREYLDSTALQATSIFNGAFADILMYNTPVLNLKEKSIGYWGEKQEWKLDFTTIPNTAAFTAEAALDDNTPRDLQIASFQISPRELEAEVKAITGVPFKLQQLSGLEEFAQFIKKQRADNPGGEGELYAKWQQNQYLHSMFSTQHQHLSNSRYTAISWTPAADFLKSFIR